MKTLWRRDKRNAFTDKNRNLAPHIVSERVSRIGGDIEFVNMVGPKTLNPMPEDYIEVENGYLSTLHVHGFKQYIEYFYLKDISNYANTTWGLFTKSADAGEAIKRANRKYIEAMTNAGDAFSPEKILDASETARLSYEKLMELRNNKRSHKNATVKIQFYAYTLKELFEERDKAKQDLTNLGYSVTVHSGFQHEEYQSFSLPLSEHTKLEKNQELNNYHIALGAPFDKISLLDPNGTYIGETASGLVVFDLNHVDNRRKQSTAVFFGQPRFGKSYLVKMLLEDLLAKNTFIRLFIFTNEYNNIIEAYDAAVVNPFGGEDRVNVFQVFGTNVDEDTGRVYEYKSFTAHLSRLVGLFESISSEFNGEDASNLNTLLWNFYSDINLLKWTDENKDEIEPITNLEVTDYPIAEDFLAYLVENIERIAKENPLSDFSGSIVKIATVLNSMTQTYAPLFNGHSNTTYNPEAQFVAFDLRAKDSVPKDIFNAQFYSIIQTVWSDAIKHGVPEKNDYINGHKKLEDVERFVVIIDEVQEYLNPTMEYAITMMNNFIKELAKFFAGAILITPSPQHFFSEEASHSAGEMKQIFNSCTYKFFFKANTGDIDVYRKQFGSTLSEAQLEAMVNFEEGDAYMVIGDAKAIKIHTYYDEEKAQFYAGGV